ncbi:MAG: response regulator [Vallitaleaceae bacterium]|nr:response regulator [Vallitaleaceae bacterium]
MYKIVIADDERIIRDGLKNNIEWNTLGFEVVELFQDGIEIIQYINKYPVDVILTDIKMITSTGIDIAKYVYDNNLNIKVVFISGYKEFEFAKKAMEYGVEYYLLKPTDIDEVYQVFEKLRTKLDHELQLKSRYNHLQNFDEALPFMKEQFFIDVVLKNKLIDAAYVDKMLKLLFPVTSDMTYFLFNIKITDYQQFISDSWQYGMENFTYMVKNFIQFYITEAIEFSLIYNIDNTLLILGLYKSSHKSEEMPEYIRLSYIDVFKNELVELFHFEVEISSLSFYANIQEIINADLSCMINETETSYLHEKSKLEATVSLSDNNDEVNLLVKKAKAHILESYLQGITLEQIADILYISPSYLSRIFKKDTGENFIEFITRLKMEKAAELLVQENYKVYEVCEILGYKSIKYFTSVFKAHFNLTPSSYRNSIGETNE